MTSTEAAHLLHMAPRTVNRGALDGRLPSTGMSAGQYRFSHKAVAVIARRLSLGRHSTAPTNDAAE